MNLIVGITGSTGVIYGIKMLETLGKLDVKTHLVMSEWAAKCILMETKYTIDQVQKLATTYSDPSNMASAISSGTHKSDGMIIAPCSMKTLAAISFGYDDTLVARAAGVTIKESRKLVLMARETPLSAIHLENMLKLSRLGVIILPNMLQIVDNHSRLGVIILPDRWGTTRILHKTQDNIKRQSGSWCGKNVLLQFNILENKLIL